MSKRPTKKKPTKKKVALEQEMLKDIGKGTSQWPSDNASPLDLSETEWRWIDGVYAADRNRDPARLIELLAHGRVPVRVMPFVARLLSVQLGRKPGRPSLLPTRKEITYHLAQQEVRELVKEHGGSVSAAAGKVAPRWRLTAKTLTGYCTHRSGYSRKLRR
jgi:hypothetical protein